MSPRSFGKKVQVVSPDYSAIEERALRSEGNRACALSGLQTEFVERTLRETRQWPAKHQRRH
jgi:hypothetical protein